MNARFTVHFFIRRFSCQTSHVRAGARASLVKLVCSAPCPLARGIVRVLLVFLLFPSSAACFVSTDERLH